jgi:hypothetical protein
MSIQSRKVADNTSVASRDYYSRTEQNRQVLRDTIFGETGNYPAIQKSQAILDGDYNFSSTDVKTPNKGS